MGKSLKVLVAYYFSQMDLFEHYLKKIQKNGKRSQYHQLRISVKNLRAMHQLFLLAGVPDVAIKPIETSLKRIYKSSGLLRDIQTNQQLVLQWSQHEALKQDYHQFLQQAKKTQKIKVLRKASKFDTNILADHVHDLNKILLRLPNAEASAATSRFLEERFLLVSKLNQSLGSDQSVHLIRKYLKEMKTIVEMSKTLDLKMGKGFKTKLVQVDKEIGQWHDLVVFRDSLLGFQPSDVMAEAEKEEVLKRIATVQQQFIEKLPEMVLPVLESSSIVGIAKNRETQE
jgi:CHAD domain-containing protein